MTDVAEINSWLTPYLSGIDADALVRLREYISILQLWNRRLALTSLASDREVSETLLGESLSAVRFIVGGKGRLADVGSGAGIPGIVLKIVLPELEVMLIEPNGKKAVFLEEIIRRLQLTNSSVIRRSVGVDDFSDAGNFDWVTSRALANRGDVLRFASKRLTTRGSVLLWVTESEVGELQSNADWEWDREVHIPNTRKRLIMRGRLNQSVSRGTDGP